MTKHETSSKAYLTIIDTDVSPTGVALKCYTHSAEGKFLAVGWLYLDLRRLEQLAGAVLTEIDLSQQPMLPPWQEAEDNVRWLPPQP